MGKVSIKRAKRMMKIHSFMGLLRDMFPPIPPRVPSAKEVEARRANFARRFVSAHAEGNVALSRGHFFLGRR
jgi:hypothetical protein